MKSKKYENWARIYNIKQIDRTLIYLRDNGIDATERMAAHTKDSHER